MRKTGKFLERLMFLVSSFGLAFIANGTWNFHVGAENNLWLETLIIGALGILSIATSWICFLLVFSEDPFSEKRIYSSKLAGAILLVVFILSIFQYVGIVVGSPIQDFWVFFEERIAKIDSLFEFFYFAFSFAYLIHVLVIFLYGLFLIGEKIFKRINILCKQIKMYI